MPNIKSVAAHANVSSATVSRVLNNDPRVSPEVRARVRASIAELGYRPNRIARSLRKQTSETIGLIVSDIENPHFTRAVRTIESAAYDQGYRVVLCNTDESPEKQKSYLEVLAAEQVIGIILVPAASDDPTISQVLDLGVPIVALDRTVDDERADAVLTDNITVAREATRHLIAGGRNRIGFIAGRPEIRTGRDRLHGYKLAMEEAGLDPIIVTGGFRMDIAQQASVDLLKQNPDLNGIVIGNNLMSIGTLQALKESGRQVPTEIALVGIDDPPWAALVSPAMTTYAQPTHAMAHAAFEMLITRIRKERVVPREMLFQFDLKVRESSGTVH